MSIRYLPEEGTTANGRVYDLSYHQLREEWQRQCSLKDEKFLKQIPQAIHLACVICWLKEMGNAVLSDVGIIHQLVHLMTNPETEQLHEIRDLFKKTLELA